MAKDAKGGKVLGFYSPRKQLARIKAMQGKWNGVQLSDTIRRLIELGLAEAEKAEPSR